ncbi:MAG: hypothetical protein K8T89_05890 [Planctomycetes bacterium]|nr:hypothetical protein [Planctomycetota bacterium]
MKRILGLSLLALFLAAHTSMAQEKTTPLYPLKVGNKWTYKVSGGTIEVKVEKKEKFAEEDSYKLETSAAGKVSGSENVVVRDDGVFRLGVNGMKSDPAVKFLAIPATKNYKWDVKAKVDKQEIEGTYVIKTEDVTVPLGTYKEATLVEATNFKVAGMDSTIKCWFVKDIGIVKLEFKLMGQEATFELEKFEQGK